MVDVNDVYAVKTPAEFVAWYDALHKQLFGNYPAKSEALVIAVSLLREVAAKS